VSPWTHLVATSEYYTDGLREIEIQWGLPRLLQALKYLDYLEAKRDREKRDHEKDLDSSDPTPEGL